MQLTRRGFIKLFLSLPLLGYAPLFSPLPTHSQALGGFAFPLTFAETPPPRRAYFPLIAK